MKILIASNAGTFAAYLNSTGEISIYEGDDTTAIAVIPPMTKRQAVMDVSTDGVTKAVRYWLESNHERLEIESIIAHLIPLDR